MYNIVVYIIIFLTTIFSCISYAGLVSNFENGTPGCHSCHSISKINSDTGGYLSVIDISSTFDDFGNKETLMEFINTSSIPIMSHVYNNNLTLSDMEQLEKDYKNINNIKPFLFEKHTFTGLVLSLIFIIVLRLFLHERKVKDE